MKNIKNIVVPTDFSVTSRNAFGYSKGLASVLDATITVVHVKEYLMPSYDLASVNVTQITESEANQALQNFINDEASEKEIMNNYFTSHKTQIKTQILDGSADSSLIELSDDSDTDLIVIGARGLQDFIARMTGTTSLNVAKGAHCPVLLIPENTHWQPIKKIMYACNYFSLSPTMVKEINDFALTLKATIHFVHVADVDSDVLNEDEDINWSELFFMTDPNLRFETHSIYGSNKVVELKKYALRNQIDLMAFVSRKRGFWENLFTKSVIQEMAFADISKPMLVLHNS